MKYNLFIFFLIHSTIAFSQAKLRGQITERSVNGKPLSGVSVSAFQANATITTEDGFFELIFPNRLPGQIVTLSIAKKGFEVVNKRELDVVLRQDPDHLIKVVMANKLELDEAQLVFFGIARVQNNSPVPGKTNDALSKKNDSIVSRKLKETEYFTQFIAEKTSRLGLDLSLYDQEFKQAYYEFKEGNLPAAQSILNFAKLSANLKKVKTLGDRRVLQITLDKFLLKGRIAFSQFNWDSADLCYQIPFKEDTLNFDYLDEYLAFLASQKKLKNSPILFRRALSLAPNTYERARTYYNATINLDETSDSALILKYTTNALECLKPLSLNEEDNTILYASILLQRAKVFVKKEQLDSAFSNYKDIKFVLSGLDPSPYTTSILTNTYLNIGEYFTSYSEVDSAEFYFRTGIKNCELILNKYPNNLTTLNLATSILYNLASLNLNHEKTINDLHQIVQYNIKVCRKLYSLNATAYIGNYIDAYRQLAEYYSRNGKMQSVDSILRLSLRLLERTKGQNNILFSAIYSYAAHISTLMGDRLKAIHYYTKSIALLRADSSLDSRTFAESLSREYYYYANFLISGLSVDSANLYFKESLKLKTLLCSEKSIECLIDVTYLRMGISVCYLIKGFKDSAEKIHDVIISNLKYASTKKYKLHKGAIIDFLNRTDNAYLANRDIVGEVSFLKKLNELFKHRRKLKQFDLDKYYIISLKAIAEQNEMIYNNIDSAYNYYFLAWPIVDSLVSQNSDLDSLYGHIMTPYLQLNLKLNYCSLLLSMDSKLLSNANILRRRSNDKFHQVMAYTNYFLARGARCVKSYAVASKYYDSSLIYFDSTFSRNKFIINQYCEALLESVDFYYSKYKTSRQPEIKAKTLRYLARLEALLLSSTRIRNREKLENDINFYKNLFTE